MWILAGLVAVVGWWLTYRRAERAEALADEWRSTAEGLARNVDELQAHLARDRDERRSAGDLDELRKMLADLPEEAQPVRTRRGEMAVTR